MNAYDSCPLVTINKRHLKKWAERFGSELTEKVNHMIEKESARTDGKIPIKVKFNGKIKKLPEDAQLDAFLLREPTSNWWGLGRLFGKKYSSCARLIIFYARAPKKAA